jgi:hypothetical protein
MRTSSETSSSPRTSQRVEVKMRNQSSDAVADVKGGASVAARILDCA